MNITFGIVTGSGYSPFITPLLTSLQKAASLNKDETEIIIVGETTIQKACSKSDFSGVSTRIVDYTKKSGWITKKKNDIVNMAKHDVVCIVHDYYIFPENFISKSEMFFKKCKMIKNHLVIPTIYNAEGQRHSDWIVDPYFMIEAINKDQQHWTNVLMSVAPRENGPQYVCGLPYDVKDLGHIQYCSGGFIMGKKDILLANPLDENLGWGDAEDLEWSRRLVKNGFGFSFNPYTHVNVQKPNKWAVNEMPLNFVEHLRECFGNGKV